MNIAILTSGGDSSGMNPCIAKLTLESEKRGYNVFGYIGGYSGILANTPKQIFSRDVYKIFKLGGTILKSGRMPELASIVTRNEVIKKLKSDKIDALIVLGGDGSFHGANAICKMDPGINIIGIPCTIDNNIYGSDYSIGHDTAMGRLVSYIDDITDTALSMGERIFIIETLGGPNDYFTQSMVDIGLCDFAITREHPMSDGAVVNIISQIISTGDKEFVIFAVAEDTLKSSTLIRAIYENTGITPKVNMIGYQQRGGVPTATERLHAASFALQAIRAVESGIQGKYIAYSGGRYKLLDFVSAEKEKPFRPWVRQ